MRDVGRNWVLNAAADYIGLRPELTAPDAAASGVRIEQYNPKAAGAVSPNEETDPGWQTEVKE